MRRVFKWSVLALGVPAIMVVCVVMVARSVPPVHQRLTVYRLKLVGALPEVGWWDLMRMSRPSSPIRFERLAETGNPYYAIKNPYDLSPDIKVGGQLFESHCATCHGTNGTGGQFGPRLQDRHMVYGDTDWAVFRTIAYGIPNTAMRGNHLSEREIWQLVAYVRNALVKSPSTASVSEHRPDLEGLNPISYSELLGAAEYSDRWLSYSGTYNSHRFSPDTQISTMNVGELRLLWMRQYNTSEETIESSPLVIGNYMFVSLPPNQVEALDTGTGKVIWSYDRRLPKNLSVCCGIVNRGLAMLGKTLYFGTFDAHLVALDIATGRVIWDREVADYRSGYSITSAPLVVKNSVVTGVAGGEFGIRGFIESFDAETGKSQWRFDTLPQPGQSSSASWSGSSVRTGGAPTWLTGSFDPESNLIFWASGNPGPDFSGESRPGDNLYSDSVLALDADSGKLRWYFQFTPHDEHDWDATEILILFDGKVDGTEKRLLAQANRNGFYYLLDRDTGAFQLAVPYVKQDWAQRIDPTGRPVLNPNISPNRKGTPTFPGVSGGANWQSPSYDSQTGLLFVPYLEHGGLFYESTPQYHAGQFFLGGIFEGFNSPISEGVVGAIDPLTGKTKWEHREQAFTVGGVLATAGGLVFGSVGSNFFGLDARTGRELWHVNTTSRISAAPISYRIDGKQVITIAAGHDLLTFGL